MERVDKILSSQGVCSRREGDKLFRAGRVTLNGVPVKNGKEKCDPEADLLCVDGVPLVFRRYVYYMMNKPAGVLTATTDKKARTVLDLLPPALKARGLFPAGRLDKDTTGLLILTDDGDFTHRLLSPACLVPKTYRLTVDTPIPPDAANRFREGVYIDGGHFTAPATLSLLSPTEAFLTITEGKYHQVKLMMKKVGCTVTSLRRVAIGSLSLPDDLPPGEVRELSEETAQALIGIKWKIS